ncbi:hypothetical protein KP509_12G080200 [Ceratopteris richardii]|nr:hypothetical protein KP509_12G080200 [Ceratopteris richardii]
MPSSVGLTMTPHLGKECFYARKICHFPPISSIMIPSLPVQQVWNSSSTLRRTFPGFGRCNVACQASKEPFDIRTFLNDNMKDLQSTWEKTEDKLALCTLGFSAFLVLWMSAGVVAAIDKLPLLPNFFELIGFLYSTWFAYQNFLFKSDRDNLREKVDAILRSIIVFENPE